MQCRTVYWHWQAAIHLQAKMLEVPLTLAENNCNVYWAALAAAVVLAASS
jgi:hypothetical protein